MAIDFSGGWNGNEVSLQTYYTGNVVLYDTITYIVQNNVDSVPIGSPAPPDDMSNWDVFVPSASGSSGTSGTSGLTGTSGTSGTTGTSGVNGTSGTSGLTGTSGTSGLTGTSGTSGNQGNSGTSGTSGSNGTTPVYSLNYSQAGAGAKVTLGASASPQNIVSVSITTTGNPVRVSAYGDAENSSAGYWSKLQLYRSSTAIGSIVHTEGSAASENSPFAFSYIDNPPAGTYTYYLKAIEISGGNISFGESNQPTINVQELNGSGSSGSSGTSGTGTSGSSGTVGTSGSSGSSGTSGTSGTRGTSGTSGNQGTSGTSGGIFSPGWTVAGSIQQVGWSATTTAPTISGYGTDEIAIWQLTDKQYQIAMAFRTDGQGTPGNGDYLFTLPSGLQFDTRLGFQTIYTGSVLTSNTTLGKYVIPSGSGMASDGSGSVTTNLMPIVWDATRFRILAHMPGTAIKCMGSNWFYVTAPIGFSLTFTFTSM